MSIATELARLRRAKNEIKEAIEDKGVDVPNDKRLDDYDDYVKMIRAATDPLEWGKIIGNIEDQEDLMELLSSLVHYEIYADLSEITDPRSSILYLIGPSGDGEDEYEEYVYDSTKNPSWIKIGDTSVDLSGYVTTQALNTALANYTTTANLNTLLAAKYEKPSTGIPSSDMASAVQTSLGKADTAYQKPNTGIPSSDMASAVQTSLGKADSAVQPADLATVATSGSYADLLNKPTIPAAPGTLDTTATTAQATSASEALSGSVALHKISKTGKYSDLSGKPTVPVITLNGSTAGTPSFYAPTSAGTAGQVLVSNGSGAPTWQAAPSGGGDVTDVTLGGTSVVDGNGVAVLPAYPVVPTLATVATTGDYDDLLNKPTIPTVPTISTDIDADKSSDTKTASPKAVADYVGNPVESISAPTPYDGTIIFTHRDGDTDTVDLNHVHPQYADKVKKESSQPVGGMLPNTFYNLGTLSGAVTFVFAAPDDNTILNEYMLAFDSGSPAASPTWPASITGWQGNCLDNGAPLILASKHYEVSVTGGYGLIVEF